MLIPFHYGKIAMDISWPVMGVTLVVMGIHWSMERGARKQREQRIARLRRPAVPLVQELHCPHCDHVISDADFGRQHVPFVPPTRRDSPYFRRDRDAT
ncbi:hypothetical protein AB6809_31060 [Paraburkholderia sp. RCC_158]|jgi:hypothetical protein|uniref:hypothetical protein n=1 Tax=Paraburkholderia sp. RCC_158 TaxID=3239220 RepID=UPI0035256E02